MRLRESGWKCKNEERESTQVGIIEGEECVSKAIWPVCGISYAHEEENNFGWGKGVNSCTCAERFFVGPRRKSQGPRTKSSPSIGLCRPGGDGAFGMCFAKSLRFTRFRTGKGGGQNIPKRLVVCSLCYDMASGQGAGLVHRSLFGSPGCRAGSKSAQE